MAAKLYAGTSGFSYPEWRKATPRGFRFSIKAHRLITHIKRLCDVGDLAIMLSDEDGAPAPTYAGHLRTMVDDA